MARETRKSGGTAASAWSRWRLLAAMVGLGAFSVATGMAALEVRDYVVRDSQFRLSRDRQDAVSIEGLRYASRSKVLRVFAPDFGLSILSTPLGERRRRFLAVDWVEDASVSRIWPDRLVVRIRERQPVAFVFLRSGVLLIDGQGVLLDPPAEAQFSFPVLSGVREGGNEPERRAQVRALLGFEADLGPLAKDVSEVNAADTENLRVVVQVDNRALELVLGDGNYRRRYQNFINHYAEIKRSSPEVKSFDLRLDDRITAKGTSAPWR